MKFTNSVTALAAVAGLFTANAAMASQATRAPTALPSISAPVLMPTMRTAKRVQDQNSLLGAPLFLIFLGATAITIGTIVIVNNNNNDSAG